ncbi:amino acid/polyamine/organocation transporter (APC superfamily) [Mycoplasma testudineum]|uniref:Amino acid/polyamine/organocation transporter (APC superfamily) n=2 Tax=Mycoplasma testudineum TaxID=244584 RepID=A0A4R6IEE1_9MOLU|nr:amino acid/polyamine/organocation transporter (APC superfamily) [Mycoplasma testudineum]
MAKNKKTAQIGYLSALIIIVGSTIGAGIFFKNGAVASYAQRDIAFIVAAWIISAAGMIFIGLALIELASSTKNDRGFLAWIKNFNNRFFSRYTMSYMLIISFPLQFLTLPLFVVQTLQDAGNFQLNGWVVAIIALGIFLWLAILTHISLNIGKALAWVFTFLKYIPLLIAPIFAFVASGNTTDSQALSAVVNPSGLSGYSKWLGLIAAVPSIIFVYDGFYTATSLRSNIKKKNSIGPLMIIGILIVTVTYLFLTIGFALGTTNGKISGLTNTPNWVKLLFNILISMSILGLINNQVMAIPRVYKSVAEDNEFFLLHKFAKLFKFKNQNLAAFSFFITIVLAYYVLWIPIGLYALTANSGASDYGQEAANLYNVADLITGFSSLVIFFWIAISILGALRNRRTGKVEVVKQKFFIVSAIISVIFIFAASGFFTVESFVNIFLLTGPDQVNAIIKFVFFVFTLVFPLTIVLLENVFAKDYLKLSEPGTNLDKIKVEAKAS